MNENQYFKFDKLPKNIVVDLDQEKINASNEIRKFDVQINQIKDLINQRESVLYRGAILENAERSSSYQSLEKLNKKIAQKKIYFYL